MNEKSLSQAVIQYPTDLIFAVLAEDVSSQLTILRRASFFVREWQFEFAIIGESHYVTIKRWDEFFMQEVLACTDLPAILQAESHKFAKLEAYQLNKQGYRSQVDFSSSNQMLSKEITGKLEMSFPAIFGVIPTTRVQWSYDKEQVRWETLHVYPLEDHTSYVFTHSEFDLHRED